jgi:hypothetical protein
LHNYYATDDGSAEFGLGLEQKGGKVAYMFILEEPDVLNRVDIHFPNIGRNQAGSGFSLFVWDELSSLKTDVIYVRENLAIDPIDRFNQFQSIRLPELLVADTFYIGWEQYTTDFMSVGFDKSHDSGHKIFYNTAGTWFPNEEFKGSLMVRPYFGEGDFTTSVPKVEISENRFHIYPNPTDEMLKIDGIFDHFYIFDLSGKMLYDEKFKGENYRYHVSQLNTGIYIIKIHNKQLVETQRLLIQK